MDERSRTRRTFRRGVAAGALAVALAAGASGLAASQGQPKDAKALGEYFFGPNMARAEVVMVVRGVVRDYRIDQGRLLAARPDGLELLERDGTRQVVPVSPAAQVTVHGRSASVADLVRGMTVITIRDGNQPADTVRALGFGKPGKPGKP
ncbi:MAG: hypothetical protein C4306_09840 [Thermoleophilia bacterium]